MHSFRHGSRNTHEEEFPPAPTDQHIGGELSVETRFTNYQQSAYPADLNESFNSAGVARSALHSPRSHLSPVHHGGQRKSVSIVAGMRTSPENQPTHNGMLARSATIHGHGSSSSSGGNAAGRAEVSPVNAWGHMASDGPRTNMHLTSPSHRDRVRTYHTESAVYTSPATAHRPSISTAMVSDATARAGATQYMHPPPPASDGGHLPTTPRNQRTRINESTPLSRRNSHAEFDSFYDRSMASNSGYNAQLNRSTLEDSAMHGRDAAMASTYNMSLANTPRTRHARVNSMVSPNTRAQHLERTQNALSGGVRGNRGLTVATHSPLEHPNRRSMMGGHSAGIIPDLPMRDTHSDTFAWGLADTSRSRTGSFAFSNNPRQSFQEPGVRTNGSKPEGSRHLNRSSYAGSIQGSSAVGSGANHGVHHRAGSSHVGGASRKARNQAQQPRSAGTAIRSNWYHKTEMLNESDLKGQDFSSSDEEDFDKNAVGDLVSQKRLIQKQQREIFDLNLRYKILDKAMAAKSENPYQEMLVDFERTCAANRCANREIEQIRKQVKELTERNEDLESRFSNPPPCSLPHGMSQEEMAKFDTLECDYEKAREDLIDSRVKIDDLNNLISIKDADIRKLEDELDRKQKDAGFWETKAKNLTESMANANANMHSDQLSPRHYQMHGSPGSDALSYRLRAGTTTTASETVTLRAPSEASGLESSAGKNLQQLAMQYRQHSPKSTLGNDQKAELVDILENFEKENRVLKAELSRSQNELVLVRGKAHEYEEQRRVLQNELKSRELESRQNAANIDSEHMETVKENEMLKDECDSLRRRLDDMQQQLDAQTEDLFTAAVSKQSAQSDDDEDASGSDQGAKYKSASSASLRVENKQLSVKLRNLERDAEEANKQKDAALRELEQLHAEQRRFNHQSLRPFIRDTTVNAAQADKVRDTLSQWGQFKVILPSADEDTTPTKKGRGYNQQQQQQQLLSPSLRIQRNRRRSNTAAVDAMSSFSASPSLHSVSDVVDDATEQENDSFGFESPSEFSPRQERHIGEVPTYSLNHHHAHASYGQN